MFVCFEGMDGAGKSTQARMLYQRLKQDGVAAELVSDPGTTRIGAAIRQLVLENSAPITPAAQMLLFSAARAELAGYITERLQVGVVVICDRWLLSTLVYQGEINKIPIDIIETIFEASANVCPDICFLLDISPDAAKARIGAPRDRYESSGAQTQERMREAYQRHATQRPHAGVVHRLDASGDLESMHKDIYALFCDLFCRTGVLPGAVAGTVCHT